jgi:hypothetical protein
MGGGLQAHAQGVSIEAIILRRSFTPMKAFYIRTTDGRHRLTAAHELGCPPSAWWTPPALQEATACQPSFRRIAGEGCGQRRRAIAHLLAESHRRDPQSGGSRWPWVWCIEVKLLTPLGEDRQPGGAQWSRAAMMAEPVAGEGRTGPGPIGDGGSSAASGDGAGAEAAASSDSRRSRISRQGPEGRRTAICVTSPSARCS